ncbi:MAG: hypothetical protein ACFCD0_10130 [Gemmataceae bacterium]
MEKFLLVWVCVVAVGCLLLPYCIRKFLAANTATPALKRWSPEKSQQAGLPASTDRYPELEKYPPQLSGQRLDNLSKIETEEILDWLENQSELSNRSVTCRGDNFTIEIQ